MSEVIVEETIHTVPQFKGTVYGIELEIEADGLYCMEEKYDTEEETYHNIDPIIPTGWLREQEDSICGVELISDKPYDFHTSVKNIQRVFADIEKQGFRPVRTPRGSTHVHANVSDITWEQMKSFVMACAWAEPALIELAGKGRKGNLFAQSYENTPIGWTNIIEWCRRKEFYRNVDTHYMATSFHPMTYLGSVEFRMGPSSRTANEAICWLTIIDAVVSEGRYSRVTMEEPSFLPFLLEMIDHKARARLKDKGARHAAEIWHGMNEIYAHPKIKLGGIKTGNFNEYASYGIEGSPLPSYLPQVTPNEFPEYPDLMAMQQAPLTNSVVPIDISPSCGDPNCGICPTLNSSSVTSATPISNTTHATYGEF